MVLGYKKKTTMPAVSRPDTAYCTVHHQTAPTHYHCTHLLLEELISHFPFETGMWGCKDTHTYTLCKGLNDYTREKATKKCQLTAVSSNRGRLPNSTIKKTFTGRPSTKFPNSHTNRTLRVLGAYKELIPCFYPKQSFSHCWTSQSEVTHKTIYQSYQS